METGHDFEHTTERLTEMPMEMGSVLLLLPMPVISRKLSVFQAAYD